jgi:hypothetical protein
MLRLLLKPKYQLYETHHRRLRQAPEPEHAAGRFDARLVKAGRVNTARIGFYAVAYFAAVAAVLSFLVKDVAGTTTLSEAVQLLAGLTSSVTILAFGGVLVCNRYLALADVELGFYSAESRMRPPTSSGAPSDPQGPGSHQAPPEGL